MTGLLSTVAAAAVNPAAQPGAEPTPPPAVSATTAAPATAPAAISAADRQAIANEASLAERTRIGRIDGLVLPGFESLAASARADGTDPGDFAIALVGAVKASGRLDAVAALTSAAAQVPPLAAAPTPAGAGGSATAPPVAEGPDKWKADYAASPKLQSEYPTEAAYVATMRRDTGTAAA